jgi:hypothetical protein
MNNENVQGMSSHPHTKRRRYLLIAFFISLYLLFLSYGVTHSSFIQEQAVRLNDYFYDIEFRLQNALQKEQTPVISSVSVVPTSFPGLSATPASAMHSVKSNEIYYEFQGGSIWKVDSFQQKTILFQAEDFVDIAKKAQLYKDMSVYKMERWDTYPPEVNEIVISPNNQYLATLIKPRLKNSVLFLSKVNGEDLTYVDRAYELYWSPDDRHLAYTYDINDNGPFNLIVFELKTGKKLMPRQFVEGISAEKVEWLTNDLIKFDYILFSTDDRAHYSSLPEEGTFSVYIKDMVEEKDLYR